MNQEAERHLAKAEGYLAKGDGYYERATDEILAAKAADFDLTNKEIGKWFGRSEKWVRDLVTWRTTSSSSTQPTPFSGQADAINVRKTRQMLREAPLEQIEQIIDQLPPERKQAVAAAAGHSYAKARQEYDERERRMTPAEREERADARRDVRRFTDELVNTFSPMQIVNHLEAAAEEYAAATERGGLTYEQQHTIDEADERWRSVLEFGRQMIGDHR